MENGKDGVLMEIRELRARAARLTGNDYYMTMQALDALAASTELTDEALHEALAPIAARLNGGAPAEKAEPVRAANGTPGGPEIPPPPDSPAEPDYGPAPEIPEVPDSPTEPDLVPTPEIPPSPASPAEPDAPPGPETGSVATMMDAPTEAAATAEAAAELAPADTAALAASSAPPTPGSVPWFPHPVSPAEAEARPAPSPPLQTSGSPPWFPLPAASAEAQASPASTPASEAPASAPWFPHPSVTAEAEALPAPTDTTPAAPEPVASSDALPAMPEPELELEPEVEPAERTGFDDLADASWRRVLEASGQKVPPPPRVSAAPPPPEPVSAPPAPMSPPAQPVALQAVEALNDGGSESRSSEADHRTSPAFSPAVHPNRDRQPADKAAGAFAAETLGQAEIPSEAAELSGVSSDAAAARDDLAEMISVAVTDVLAIAGESGAPTAAHTLDKPGEKLWEAQLVRTAQPVASSPAPQPVQPPATSEPAKPVPFAVQWVAADDIAKAKPEVSAADTVPVLSGADLAARPEEPEAAIAAETKAAIATAEREVAQAAADVLPKPTLTHLATESSAVEDEPTKPDAGQEKATRRGFFGRLFGSRAARR